MAKKKLDRYFTPEDVRMRLDASVVLYKGKPFYAAASGMDLRLWELGGSREQPDHKVSANSADLDIRSIELGYVNSEGSTFFAYRVPYRKQKQGMACDNIEISSLLNPEHKSGIGGATILSKPFRDMLVNKYPSIKECSQLGQFKSGAFSKNFAIRHEWDKKLNCLKQDGKYELVCNQKVVGIYDPVQNGVILDEFNNHSVMTLKLVNLGVTVLN